MMGGCIVFEIQNIALGLFLAYYWTGFEMVEFHTTSHPVDRPAYVDFPLYKKTVSAMLWPFVAKINFEFGWFFSCFVSYAVVITVVYSIASDYLPAWIFVAGVVILRQIPILGVIFNAPAALVASLVFLPLSKIFGWKVPEAIGRMRK